VNPPSKKSKNRPTVIILGSGWGGLSCAKEIDTNRYEVILVSPRNHFLFTPGLIETTFGIYDNNR
jgi:NADH:ubiquinone reductase (non-electrogenic)